jgi:hypothetical protein
MRQITSEANVPLAIEEIAQAGMSQIAAVEQITDANERTISTPPYAALLMPASRAALMAVIDENGLLTPLCTAGDLLRSCKYFWRASRG